MQGGRAADRTDLAELSEYSTSVVQRVYDGGEPMVVTGTEEGQKLGSESAVVFDLRSIMAAPLKLRDETMGVVYFDSRLAKGLFTEGDSDVLMAVGNHIAVAFETARLARVEAEKRVLEKDLALTAAVQSFFLPKQHRRNVGRFELVGSTGPHRSAAATGGGTRSGARAAAGCSWATSPATARPRP